MPTLAQRFAIWLRPSLPTRRYRPARPTLTELEPRVVPVTTGYGSFWSPYTGVAPVVSFSADQSTVSVVNNGAQYTMTRPVVSPWNYQPAGRIYWVDPTGSDQSSGDAGHPFATINRAIAAANPGDAVYINPGTYTGAVTITRSGTANLPIIISCAPGALGQVKITPSAADIQRNPGGAVITLSTADNVWVNGLVVAGTMGKAGAPASDHFGANGITLANGAGLGDRITNNVVYGNLHCGIKELGHGGTDYLLQGNIILDNGTTSLDHGIYAPSDSATIDGNIIFDNAGWGIHAYSTPQHQVITHNVVFGQPWGGILLAGANNTVEDNTVVYNATGIMYFRAGCTGNTVDHNIVAFNTTDCGYDNGGGSLGDPSGNTDDANDYWSTGVASSPGGSLYWFNTVGPNEVLVNPQFRNAAAGNFSLSAQSTVTNLGAFASVSGPPPANVAPSGLALTLSAPSINEGGTVSLSGTFQDAGDTGAHSVVVSWGDGQSSTLSLAGGVFNFGELAHQYLDNPVGQPTGSYTIGVTVTDQQQARASVSATVRVNNVTPTVSVAGPSGGVRGQPRTFTFSAGDVSPADRAASFIYAINWGDGTTQQVAGGISISLDHAYVANGNYVLGVTATDKDKGTSAAASQSISIVAVQVQGGDLVVGGTTGNDAIILTPASKSAGIDVKINGVSMGTFQPTGHIFVFGQAGDDTIQLQSVKIGGVPLYITVPAILDGSAGNDTISTSGSTAANVLISGGGTDTLAGTSRDVLFYGSFADWLASTSGL